MSQPNELVSQLNVHEKVIGIFTREAVSGGVSPEKLGLFLHELSIEMNHHTEEARAGAFVLNTKHPEVIAAITKTAYKQGWALEPVITIVADLAEAVYFLPEQLKGEALNPKFLENFSQSLLRN